jgi:hypothetical protein
MLMYIAGVLALAFGVIEVVTVDARGWVPSFLADPPREPSGGRSASGQSLAGTAWSGDGAELAEGLAAKPLHGTRCRLVDRKEDDDLLRVGAG